MLNKVYLSIFFLASIVFSKDTFSQSFYIFENHSGPNFCLNDFSNYPIGLFKLKNKKDETIFHIDFNEKIISIKKTGFAESQYTTYFSTNDYLASLIKSNREKTLFQSFALSSSDTTYVKSKDSFVEIAGLDLGGLGRASLRVQGNINISGKLVNQDQELVRSSYREQQTKNFKFDQKQQLNVQGKVGERITISLDQNSERDFDWENTIRVDYQGDEDDILQRLEAGNISLSLPGTEFVTFSGQNRGLFGIKALTRLGPVDITSIASLEKTQKETQKYKGSSELKATQIPDYDYRKNLYFFVHEWFRSGAEFQSESGFGVSIPSYYPLVSGLHPIGNVVIRNLELYKIDTSNNPQADPGTAYIDPLDLSAYTNDNKEGSFIKLERGIDYSVNEDLGFVRMQSSLQNEILAGHFEIVDRESGQLIVEIGSGINESSSSLVLKMIKAQSSHPNHPTWDLMFKNVYSLGSLNIDPTNLKVTIVDNLITPVSDRTETGKTYLHLFGLDNLNSAGEIAPDENIDYNNPNIINLQTGEIHLPSLLPFVSDDKLSGGNSNEELKGILRDGEMYISTNRSDFTGDSRFTLNVEYTSPKSVINLGFTLVEGSEELYYNGEKLQKGRDYQVDYFSGMIMILKNIDPEGELDISYDKHELVTFDRKLMIGSRAQIDFNDDSFLGMTALYYNQDIVNKKVEVGYEPINNFIWDLNGRYQQDFEKFSKSINDLPFVNSDKLSGFTLEGEFAQVLPNPNSISIPGTGDNNGVAYIDDFEGSKRVTNPSILRRFWHISSAPINAETMYEFKQENRMRMFWYNPYAQVLTNSIWPNVSTSQRAQNLTTDVLVLNVEPKLSQQEAQSDSLWAGIISPMFVGDYDQTKTKFFEIWLRGEMGNLTIDLGKISEDYDGNSKLNDEDVPEAGLALGNGFLEENEDTGLDGCFDEYENGWGQCLDTDGPTYLEYFASGETILINAFSDTDASDPNGDNWDYIEGSNDYSMVNGTEGNGTGVRIQAGGKYPDSEDLDNSGFLDRTNSFYSKTISLSDSTYVAGRTEFNGQKTGWKLIRIPISHFDHINDVSLSEIKYLRLAISGITEASKLEVAKVELVGNSWEEVGTSLVDYNNYTLQDSTFVVTVINDEDNPDYIPPKGVFGEYDEINQILSKEQSLVLKFDNLQPNYKGAAKKIITLDPKRGQSYLMYDLMKMFIYGNSEFSSIDESDLDFFIEFGAGDEYYKVTKKIYKGWDQDLGRNDLNVDLDWITRLKNAEQESIQLINPNDTFTDSLNYKRYELFDLNNELLQKIEVYGQPALSRIQYFVVGVENNSNNPISGEIWLDELRLSGVKKDKGNAMRIRSQINLSDFSESNFSYTKKDADFRVLQERLGSNNSNESLIVSNNFQLGGFFPKEWGISMPLSTSYSMQNNKPKYFPGSDVRTNQSSVPDSIMKKTSTIKVSSAISKKVKSQNPIMRYTIDNMSSTINLSSQKRSDEIMEHVNIHKINGDIKYNLQFPSDNYLKIFGWTKSIPIVGEQISETKFFYTPTNFNSSMIFSRNLSNKKTRSADDNLEDFNLGLTRTFGLSYKIFDNTQLNYIRNVNSDLSEYRNEVLQKISVGSVVQNTEAFSSSFSPDWFEWISPTFNYNANYSWNKPLSSVVDGANLVLTKSNSINFNLSPTTIMEQFYEPPSKSKSSSRSRTRIREVESEESDSDKMEPEKAKKYWIKDRLVVEKIYEATKKIQPIIVTFNTNTNLSDNGVQSSIPVFYKLGLNDNRDFSYAPEVGFNTGVDDIKKSLSIRSGIKINNSTSLSFSFNENISSVLNGSGVDTRSITRDYFSFGTRLNKGFPFSNWSLRIGGIEKIKILNHYFSSVSLEHSFAGKQVASWKFSDSNTNSFKLFSISSIIDNYNENLLISKKVSSFSPLMGLTASLKNGVSFNLRNNISYTLDEVPTGLSYVSDNSILGSITYNFSKGIRFALPFTDRNVFLNNNFNLTLNLESSNKNEEGSKDRINFAQQNFNKTNKAVLRASYAITENVSGSLFYEYRQNETRLTGRRVDRDFGINLNVVIRE